MLQRRKLVLKLAAPDTLSTCAISKRIAPLNHEFPNHAMEDGAIIVSVPAMCHKVLDRLWRRLGEQSHVDISHRRVDNCRLPCLLDRVCTRLLGCSSLPCRLLVEDIAVRLGGSRVVGEYVEAGLLVRRAEEHGVAGLGFGEKRVGGRGHFDGYQCFFGGCALVEGEVEGTDNFFPSKEADDSVCDDVDNLDTRKRAVDNEMARLVEDHICL